MKNRIRVRNDDAVVKNAVVEILNEQDEWIDIRKCVTGIRWDVRVGEVSMITLDLLPAEVGIAGIPSEETLRAFADTLRGYGWSVERDSSAVKSGWFERWLDGIRTVEAATTHPGTYFRDPSAAPRMEVQIRGDVETLRRGLHRELERFRRSVRIGTQR